MCLCISRFTRIIGAPNTIRTKILYAGSIIIKITHETNGRTQRKLSQSATELLKKKILLDVFALLRRGLDFE